VRPSMHGTTKAGARCRLSPRYRNPLQTLSIDPGVQSLTAHKYSLPSLVECSVMSVNHLIFGAER
jgi:hypothetical protein